LFLFHQNIYRNLKRIFQVLIISLSGQLFAQRGVYLSPYFETSAGISHYDGRKPFSSSPYFQFENKKISYPWGISPGILIGYSFNKNRSSIEIGLGDAESLSGYKLHLNSGNDSMHFVNSLITSYGGTAGYKIPILFSTQLYRSDSIRIYNSRPFSFKLSIKVGINLYRQPMNNNDLFKPLISSGMDSILVAPNTLIDYEEKVFVRGDKSTLYQLGFVSEFNFRKIKGLCISFYYLYGRRDLSLMNVRVTVNKQINYYYNFYGRGSAFCFQISKKIYYPKRKNK
jgi:hypothetical protein